MRLVCVVNFVPYRNLYLSSFTHSCTSYLTLPALPSLFTYPAPNCLTTANVKEHLPVLSLKLPALMDRLTLTQAGSSYGQTQG
ncbi:hypothetical protein Pmani_010462 [Petrolisthes manimaculis]|nr:hypothetical protein Pmani_010462 [Petrolisthes manimaculis]